MYKRIMLLCLAKLAKAYDQRNVMYNKYNFSYEFNEFLKITSF